MADVGSAQVAAYVAAGICMGIGTLGPALGMGLIGGKACESIGKNIESADKIERLMLMSLAFVESAAVYALVVSLMLLFYVGS